MRLTPKSALTNRPTALLAADASTLANADAMRVHLIKVPFTPSSYIYDPDDEATFTGSAFKSVTVGTQTFFTDPVTANKVIEMKEPAGGWTWLCTADPATPETIYGVCLTDDGGVTYGSALLEEGPVVIAASGDGLSVGNLQLWFPPGFMG